MENYFLYFTPFYIIALGIIISIISANALKNRSPKFFFTVLTTTLLVALLGFFPFIKGFLKLSGFFEPMKNFISYLPFENYSRAFLGNSMIFNPLNVLFGFLTVLTGLVTSILSFDVIKKLNQKSLNFTLLFLLSVFGALGLCASNDFLSLIISLEIVALSLIFITLLVKNNTEHEAGLKTFFLNTVATCLMLFGTALIYLHTGTINFSDLNILMINSKIKPSAPYEFGQIFLVAGLLGKIGAAPFIAGIFDFLKGANKTSFMLTLSLLQTAVVLGLIKIIIALGTYGSLLNFALILFSGISLIITSLIAARTVKKEGSIRLLVGSICLVNLSFTLFSIAFFTKLTIAASIFSLIVSLATNFALFAGFGLISRNLKKHQNHLDSISIARGLSHISPFYASTLTVIFLSIAGIPFTAGFISKFYILTEIARGGIWTIYSLLFAGLAILLNLYACFKFITLIFQRPQIKADKIYKKLSIFNKLNPYVATLSICAVILFALFLVGGYLMNIIEAAL